MSIKGFFNWYILKPLQKLFRGYSYDEYWETTYHMSKKILPMIKRFKKSKRMGYPCDMTSEEWEKILDAIIYSLELCIDENDDDCCIPNEKYNPEQKEMWHCKEILDNPKLGELVLHDDYGTTRLDFDLLMAKARRKQEGLDLLGKHWQSFWD
jgi:hypothetical protein